MSLRLALLAIPLATPATSGACKLLDGNVGFYSGGQLVALLFGTRADAPMIGSLRPVSDGLRILSGALIAGSVADLSQDGSALIVTLPATEEPVCNAAAVVPAIEGQPIDKARSLLMQSSWQPVPGAGSRRGQGHRRRRDSGGRGLLRHRLRLLFLPPQRSCGGAFGVTASEGREDGSRPAVVRYWTTCCQGAGMPVNIS